MSYGPHFAQSYVVFRLIKEEMREHVAWPHRQKTKNINLKTTLRSGQPRELVVQSIDML